MVQVPPIKMVIWGMVYDCFTNSIPFCLPQTRDIHSTQLLDCATVRQLRVPQALASSRAYWESTWQDSGITVIYP